MNINTLYINLVKRANVAEATVKSAGVFDKLKTLAGTSKDKAKAILNAGKDKAVTFGKNRWQGVKNDWDDMFHATTLDGNVDWLRRGIGAAKLGIKTSLPPAIVAAAYKSLSENEPQTLEDYIEQLKKMRLGSLNS